MLANFPSQQRLSSIMSRTYERIGRMARRLFAAIKMRAGLLSLRAAKKDTAKLWRALLVYGLILWVGRYAGPDKR
ncbi:hypothetical protein RZS28_16340 [Methylocapsa polymorpha]|uniref:Transposase n=1 Tax=Methylocapsa polymorpha TaxID=3080828 RepID=A0ABZ0HRB4_9HYPH|nr:hypothetical protein RZS28_16340 [Methylocapsa sp. RX1]